MSVTDKLMVDTSLDAYNQIKGELGARQRVVLDAINHIIYTKNTYPTNLEISQFLGIPINSITPRSNELAKLGKIWNYGKRTCKVSGRMARVWRC